MGSMDWLSIGSVVKIHELNYEVLIVSRGFVFPIDNTFNYYDYYGVDINNVITSAPSFLFNNSDIESVVFEGWNSTTQIEIEKKFFVNVASKGIKKAKKTVVEQKRIGF